MELEQLNKSQIVLLTLLVSFMTSIATGIVTVALMEQAPPAITETVNRVVERTVERVVPSQAAAAASPGKTVVIKESDLIAEALKVASPSVVRVYATGTAGDLFLGMGIVIDGKGTIAIDESSLGEAGTTFVDIGSGVHVSSALLGRDSATGLAFLSVATSTTDGKPVLWKPAMLSNKNPAMGETVVLLSGKTSTRIATGIITALSPLSEGIKDAIQVLDTSIAKSDILAGSPIMDTEGSIVGVSTGVSRASSESGFIPARVIKLPEVKENTKPTP